MAHVRSLFFNGPLDTSRTRRITAYKLGRPSDVIWNITNRCNLLCDHCYMAADGHALPDELTDEETIALVHQMGERELPVVFLSGGEPMMRPNFWEILETRARTRHPRHRLDQRTLIDRDVAKRLKANGIDWIATSLYGPAEFHDEMVRVPGHPAKVDRGHQDPARGGRRRRDQDRGQQGHVAVHLRPHRRGQGTRRAASSTSATSSPSGRSEGEDDGRITAEQWRELADFIIDDILDRGVARSSATSARCRSFIPYVAEKLLERGVDVTNGLERLKIITACPVGKGHMNINSEGGIMPCQFAQDWTIGNIRDLGIDGATRELFKLSEHKPKGKCASVRVRRDLPRLPHEGVAAEGDPMAEDPTCMLDPEFEHGELLIRKALSCCAPGGCS